MSKKMKKRGIRGAVRSLSRTPIHSPTTLRVSHRQKVLPNQVIEATVRTTHRRHVLKPCREITNAFQYLVALLAKKYGVKLYGASLMSTHYKVVIRDVEGRQPDFFRELNRMLAQFVNRMYGLSGSVFANKPRRTICETPESIVEAMGGVLAGPVTAGAVRYAKDWPGFRTQAKDIGRRIIKGKRPVHFFGKRKTLPKAAQLEISVPEELLKAYGTRAAVVEALEQSAVEQASKARAILKEGKSGFVGKRASLKLCPTECAERHEVFSRPRQRISTTGMTANEIKAEHDDWINWNLSYDACRKRLLKRETNITWPYGTWAMARHFGQLVATPQLT